MCKRMTYTNIQEFFLSNETHTLWTHFDNCLNQEEETRSSPRVVFFISMGGSFMALKNGAEDKKKGHD